MVRTHHITTRALPLFLFLALIDNNPFFVCVFVPNSAAAKKLSWDVLAAAHKLDRERISADDVALIKMYFCDRLPLHSLHHLILFSSFLLLWK